MRPEATKRCISCDTEKPLGEYYHDPKGTQGRLSECKRCHADRVWFAKREAEIEARYAVVDAAFGAGGRKRWARCGVADAKGGIMIYLAMHVTGGCEDGQGNACRFLALCEAAIRRQHEVICELPDEAAGVDPSKLPHQTAYEWLTPGEYSSMYQWWKGLSA